MVGAPWPMPETQDPALRDWAARLIARLSLPTFEESPLEAQLAFGGVDLSNRIFGVEGTFTGYTAPADTEVLAAPAAGKKRILLSLVINNDDSGGTENFLLFKKKNSTEYPILAGSAGAASTNKDLLSCMITLDDAAESLRLRALAGADDDFHWEGSYIDLD